MENKRNLNRDGWYDATNTEVMHYFVRMKPLCTTGFPFYMRIGRKVRAQQPQEDYCEKCSKKLKRLKDESDKKIPEQDNISFGSEEPQAPQLLREYKGVIPVQ